MSSPSQRPNSFRQSSSDPSTLQQSTSMSPFSKHLPPPPLPLSNGPPISLPPPRMLDRPYQSPMRSPVSTPSSHSPFGLSSNSPSIGGYRNATNSFGSSEHTGSGSKPILPPLPTRAPSPYEDRNHGSLPLPSASSFSQQQERHQRSETRTPPSYTQKQEHPQRSATRTPPPLFGQQQEHSQGNATRIPSASLFDQQQEHYQRNVTRTPAPLFGQQQEHHQRNATRISTPPFGHQKNATRTSPPPFAEQQEYGHRSANRISPPTTQQQEYRFIQQQEFQQRSRTRTPPPSLESSASYRPLNVRDALTYLDLVKIKFSDQTDVYNQFLDIMKDFKSQAIDTPGVIERVSTLFKGFPNLISGFNTFLPPGYQIECSSDPHQPDLIRVTSPDGTVTTTGGRPKSTQKSALTPGDENESPTQFNNAITFINKIKARFANDPNVYKQFLDILQTYQNDPNDQNSILQVYVRIQYLFNGAPDLFVEFKRFLPDIIGPNAGSGAYDDDGDKLVQKKRGPGDLGGPGKRSKPNEEDVLAFDPVHPTVSAEEVDLFERIRKHIGNKPSYDEFLKTLNLYTQQILDLDMLMTQVQVFIGNNKELFDWFKTVLAYQSKEPSVTRPARTVAKPDLMHCATVADSPSYRLTPVDWQNQPCSGRDALAWEVLNDMYVSHPIWSSEDDGFVASKKSQYEEAMHRCEEERYDYNMTIEANLNVIALLEPISKRLETMTADEKAVYRLYPGLGGQSVSIYERIIKKVYDKDRGLQIIELLYSHPDKVVPILLNRLKQKDKEWKKAQREWNKIWCESDVKNYYRSLDYQGITYKGNDRKGIAVKTMVAEIQSKKHKTCQYEFSNKSVFGDVTRVVYSYMDRQAGFTHHDRDKVRTFIRSFIPLCFGVDDVEPEGVGNYWQGRETVDDDDDSDGQSTNTEDSESDVTRSPGSTRFRRRRNQEDDHTMDLLRDVLTRNKQVYKGEKDDTTLDVLTAAAAATAPESRKRNVYSFFCNTTFYAFFRLFEMIYGRLLKLYKLNEIYQADRIYGKKTNPVALQLGLYTTKFDDIDTSKGYYQAVLGLIDRYFEGDIESQYFEESLRYFFVTDAYLLFTIDKLVHALVKQIQAVTIDKDSVELVRLFRSDQELDITSRRLLSVYRLRAEEVIGSEENLYKINFDTKSGVMTIQLLDGDDYMMEPIQDKYEDYVLSYMDWIKPTDGVNVSQMKSSYLKRNLKVTDGHLQQIYVRSQLQYKIDQDTYKMYYIDESEDVFIRPI